MLTEINAGPRTLEDYLPIIGVAEAERVRAIAKTLAGKKIGYINATSFGGGVAELLHSMIPLMIDLGLDIHWYVMSGDKPFFDMTKTLHNSLQGAPAELTPAMKDTYLDRNCRAAKALAGDFDILMIHDPQPLATRHFTQDGWAKWVWRVHVDTSCPNPQVWDFLRPYVAEYDAAIYTLPAFRPQDLDTLPIHFIQPAIDPLSLKNMELATDDVTTILRNLRIDLARPWLLQVSRFDQWKDPLGVIDAYRLVKEEFPDLQLVLAGSMATDDPQGWEYYCRTVNYAEGDPDVHTIWDIGAVEINALQRMATVVVQKSIREGFGLVVSEAMYKSRPIVASDVGGISVQVEDGVTGLLCRSNEECAEKISELLNGPQRAKRLGQAGYARVRENFLITRLVADDMRVMASL